MNESAVDRKSKQIRHLLCPPLNDVEAAKFLGVATQTLRNWRHQRKGPPYLKISRSVRYRLDDLENFMNSKRIDPEKAA
ncbi:MAG: helix-turn-helix domain-containing protein [Thermodesulfobacteriota bacterium]|nr:helix-turn-helix domain-containing protein [Thermodesulfobacteriota bacterium]